MVVEGVIFTRLVNKKIFAREYLFKFVDMNFDSFISCHVISGTHLPYIENQKFSSVTLGNHLILKKFEVIFHKELVMPFSSISSYGPTGGHIRTILQDLLTNKPDFLLQWVRSHLLMTVMKWVYAL
jgi:hypothetical protein